MLVHDPARHLVASFDILVGAAALLLPLFARVLSVAAPETTPDRSADAAAIRAHIDRIFQAFIDKDHRTLAETHGANWRGFTPYSGRVIRGLADYLATATFPEGLRRDQGLVGYRILDFDVVFYGDVAVVSFVAACDEVAGDERHTETLTLMDVYHLEPSGWIQVASNTSLHPDTVAAAMSRPRTLSDADRAELLMVREAVWRAWFTGDTDALGRLLPPDLVTVDPDFGTRASTLETSRRFTAGGVTLQRLEFPRTDFQAYGNTVVIYTLYDMDIANGSETHTYRGSATEVFVRQQGRWINTGWHLAPAGTPQ
jgi:hypothetical protein